MHEYTDPAIRITLLPRDTNSRGTIFGGVILSYIDTAGAIQAHRHTRMERFVTVAMKEVIFHKPVFVGDLVSFYAEIVRVGSTSITVRVIVEVERLGKSERVRVTEAEVIYVAVDEHGEKIQIVKSSSSSLQEQVAVPALTAAAAPLIESCLHSSQRYRRFSKVRFLLERQTVMPRSFKKPASSFINTPEIKMGKSVRLVARR
jgi:acyl-CoA thioesterase YciA